MPTWRREKQSFEEEDDNEDEKKVREMEGQATRFNLIYTSLALW